MLLCRITSPRRILNDSNIYFKYFIDYCWRGRNSRYPYWLSTRYRETTVSTRSTALRCARAPKPPSRSRVIHALDRGSTARCRVSQSDCQPGPPHAGGCRTLTGGVRPAHRSPGGGYSRTHQCVTPPRPGPPPVPSTRGSVAANSTTSRPNPLGPTSSSN